MTRTLTLAAAVLSVAMVAPAAAAAVEWHGQNLAGVLDTAGVFQQRKDVLEVSLPPPPRGPATPLPYCGPAQPVCP